MKVLLIQLRQLGDIILTTPCIREIKRELPHAHITFFSHEMGKLILDGNPYLDEMFYYRDGASLMESIRLIRSIANKKFDVVIDFMNNPRSSLFTYMSGASERIAFQSPRSLAYSRVVPRIEEPEYIVKEKFRLLSTIGVIGNNEALDLPWLELHAGVTIKYFHDYPKLRDAPIRILMSATHRREARRWSLEKYAALSDWLTTEWGAAVTWLWGPGEESFIDSAMTLCKHNCFKSPATKFSEMAALVANHDLFVGNSNGPSHVAVANNICSLQLHGPTLAKSWCPLTQQHQAIQSASTDINEITFGTVTDKLSAMHSTVKFFAATRPRETIRTHWLPK